MFSTIPSYYGRLLYPQNFDEGAYYALMHVPAGDVPIFDQMAVTNAQAQLLAQQPANPVLNFEPQNLAVEEDFGDELIEPQELGWFNAPVFRNVSPVALFVDGMLSATFLLCLAAFVFVAYLAMTAPPAGGRRIFPQINQSGDCDAPR